MNHKGSFPRLLSDKQQDSELAVIGRLVVLCQIALVQDVFVHAYFRDFPYSVDSKALVSSDEVIIISLPDKYVF